MAANEYYTGRPAVHPQDLYGGSQRPQSTYSQAPPPYEPLPPQQPHQQFQAEAKPQFPQQGYAHTNGDYDYHQQPQQYQQYPPQQYQQYPPQQQQQPQYSNTPTSHPYQQPPPAETGSFQRPPSQGQHANGYNSHVSFDDRPYSQSPQLRPYDRRSSTPHSRHSHHSRSPSRDRHHHRDSSRSSYNRSGSGSGSKSRQRKKGNLDTFVGAGGGAIIGDAIFPGLGTIGGALLGGLGGKKVANEKRRDSEDLKHYEEYHGRHRSRSHRSYSDSDSEKDRRRRH